jgi:hypothetical protein
MRLTAVRGVPYERSASGDVFSAGVCERIALEVWAA